MMKSSRNNRLMPRWTCPHCSEEILVDRFRLSANHPGCVMCPREDCLNPFPWKQHKGGRLWPEHAAYRVLR
jgi:hypothetical protein